MLKLPRQLTHDQAEACLAALRQALPAAITLVSEQASQQAGEDPAVLLDASALERFDSSALAVLLACRRMALGAGRRLLVRDLPPQLRQLAGLYGIADLIPAAA